MVAVERVSRGEDDVQITLDAESAQLLKVLAGFGLVHFSADATRAAEQWGTTIGEIRAMLSELYHPLVDAL